AIKDTSDGISIFVDTFEDTFDFVINAAEVGQVDILGLVRQVEDGQTITVTVTDGSATLSYTTLVAGLTWSIADADLSSLQDGPLTFNAQVTDIAGNTTSATTVKQKDTQAAITIAVDTNTDVTDNTINAAEMTQVAISGTVSNVEDGQTVTLTVTDGTTALTFDTSVTAGAWT
ncbi:Ig-like domain-containing protein, partial [Colwelliaceae bacterium MEBiC 14330]